MNKLLVALLATLLLTSPLSAQQFNYKYYASPPTYSIEGQGVYPLVDANGRIITSSSSATTATVTTCTAGAGNLCKAEDGVAATTETGVAGLGVVTDGTTSLAASGDYSWFGIDAAGNTRVVGNVASGTADAGNPVKVGGIFSSTLPTLTDGQRGNLQLGTRGSLNVTILASNGSAAATVTTPADAAAAINGVGTTTQGLKFNGSTWDRDFTCPSSAIINVTAGNTTELVALSGSTVIRVCGFVVTGNVAGSAQFRNGTGANCGTGIGNLTGAMNVSAAGNISHTGMSGSVFRTPAGNALCLTAATANITGFVTYAQF